MIEYHRLGERLGERQEIPRRMRTLGGARIEPGEREQLLNQTRGAVDAALEIVERRRARGGAR